MVPEPCCCEPGCGAPKPPGCCCCWKGEVEFGQLGELGLAGFEDVPYYAFFAPAGTPQAEIDRFSSALGKVIAMAEVKDKLTAWGLSVGLMPQAQLAARERAYAQAWARIIKASGYQPQ